MNQSILILNPRPLAQQRTQGTTKLHASNNRSTFLHWQIQTSSFQTTSCLSGKLQSPTPNENLQCLPVRCDPPNSWETPLPDRFFNGERSSLNAKRRPSIEVAQSVSGTRLQQR